MHGWIIIDKPLGLSSAQGVAAVKRLFRQAGWPKVRIGHGGTLDPLATGVLPIAFGEATKLTGRMRDATQGYRITVRFGAATATDDAEGAVVAESAVRPTRAALEAMLPRFTGSVVQVPPAYSALKVEGQRAYALARAGETVELAARTIEIFTLILVAVDESGEGVESATLDLSCSKGTYVRSLARDLAVALGTVGHVTELRRTRAGPFGLDQAIPLDKLQRLGQEDALERAILPLTAGLDDIPALSVDPDQAAKLRQGQRLSGLPVQPGTYVAIEGSVPVALVEISPQEIRVVRGFNI